MELTWTNKVQFLNESSSCHILSGITSYKRCSTQLVWVFFTLLETSVQDVVLVLYSESFINIYKIFEITAIVYPFFLKSVTLIYMR